MYQSSLDLESSDLPKVFPSSWYDTFLFDAERSGLLLEATLDESQHSATIVMGNINFQLWMEAVDFMVNLADLHLPITVSIFNIVVEEEGHRVNSIRMIRPSLNFGKNRQLVEREIRIEPLSLIHLFSTELIAQKKVLLDINLNNRVQLFDLMILLDISFMRRSV